MPVNSNIQKKIPPNARSNIQIRVKSPEGMLNLSFRKVKVAGGEYKCFLKIKVAGGEEKCSSYVHPTVPVQLCSCNYGRLL